MTTLSRVQVYVRPRVLRPGFFVLAAVLVVLAAAPGAAAERPAAERHRRARLSEDLAERLARGRADPARVIVTGSQAEVDRLARRHGLRVKKRLQTGAVVDVPDGGLEALAADTDQLSSDFRVRAQMSLTTATTGASQVWDDGWIAGMRGVTGRGVGVAVIDSGVDVLPELRGRVVASLDFIGDRVRGRGADDYGHGTHVAGIIAATGRHRHDDARGMAPGAHIVSLKVLGADGSGRAADVVEAIDWAIAHRRQFNIRVINLSLGAAVLQPWADDPVCQAVERAFRAGITVVASAGNFGETADGRLVYGGITSPGNSPYALTVGASSTKSTVSRSDDQPARRSSKGPTRFDRVIKPDLLAPGMRITGLLARNAALASAHPELIVNTSGRARLQLSGTSMSAGVASGAVALLAERARLSPLETRIALQYTARRPEASLLVAGAGYLNVPAALSMPDLDQAPPIAGEVETATGVAFAHAVLRAGGDNVVWGESDSVVWGNHYSVVWGNGDSVVWGNHESVVWGNDNSVVWGNSESVVWGNDESVVWGNDESVVWGNTAATWND